MKGRRLKPEQPRMRHGEVLHCRKHRCQPNSLFFGFFSVPPQSASPPRAVLFPLNQMSQAKVRSAELFPHADLPHYRQDLAGQAEGKQGSVATGCLSVLSSWSGASALCWGPRAGLGWLGGGQIVFGRKRGAWHAQRVVKIRKRGQVPVPTAWISRDEIMGWPGGGDRGTLS